MNWTFQQLWEGLNFALWLVLVVLLCGFGYLGYRYLIRPWFKRLQGDGFIGS